MKNLKKLCALILSLAMLATMFSGMQFVADADTVSYASRLVTNDYGTYVEHNGKPYLMYGAQLRVDWQYADKKLEDGTTDWDWIEENFQKAVEDGFKTVAIPVYWSFIETGNHGVTSTAYLEKMYEYVYKYDLTVQWLWLGSNVCGEGYGTSPWYVINDSEKYSRLKKIEWDTENLTYEVTESDSPFFDFSDEDTMKAEQNALAVMMEYIAERDTERRCVMIQINNEIDQGGNYWLPKTTDENGNVTYYDTWWTTEEGHDKYCYAFGQREALFTQLDALGDVIHNSGYNCVTRVNLSDACRPTLANDDYTDLLTFDGIDIVGIDCYDTILSDIESSITDVEGNVTHLAECATGYDSSINSAILFENGIGNFIYCHRTDRTGGGMYVPDKNDDTGVYNRQYKEWVERESTPAIRAYNAVINKAYEKVAKAVSEGEFVALTADSEVENIGGTSFTLSDSSENDKLAIALKANATEYVLMSVKNDCAIAVSGNNVVSAEVGAYDDSGVWIKEHNATVDGATIAVEAGDAVLVKVENADISGSVLADTGETLENGAKIYKVSENGGTVVLNESIQDFAIEFKYMDVATVSANPFNMNVNMRGGKYALAIHNWATLPAEGGNYTKSHDLRFVTDGKTSYGGNGHFSVADNVWTQFKIVMAGQRVTVLKNGTVWYSADLKDAATAGALELDFSGTYETYIADVKVTTAVEKDTYTLVDADLKSDLYDSYSVDGTTKYPFINKLNIEYDSTTGGSIIGSSNDWNSYTMATGISNYEFNIDLQMANMPSGVQGIRFTSPSGYSYWVIADCLMVKDSAGTTLKTYYNNTLGSKFNDGAWHNLRIDLKDSTETLYVNNKLIHTITDIAGVENGSFILKMAKDSGTVYVKEMSIIETSNLSRTTAMTFPELNSESYSSGIFGYGWANDVWESFTAQGITGAKVTNTGKNGRNPMFKDTEASNCVLSMKVYLDSSESTNLEFYMRGRLEASSNGFYVNLKQDYCQVNGTKASKVTFETPITDRWVDLEMYMFNTNAIVVVDGIVIADFSDINYDFSSGRVSYLITGSSNGNSIAVADVKMESLDGLMNAIENIEAVTYDENGIADEALRTAAITSYIRLYSAVEKQYLENNTSWFEVYYDHGDVNTNGNVDVLDLVRLKKIAALQADATAKSDINRDSLCNSDDMTILRQVLLGTLN